MTSEGADERLRAARRALNDYGAHRDDRGEPGETEEFHRLNTAVHAAEADASWWARGNG
ncbi:MAG: hypothetical protein ACREX8_05120 [Gammaproteobacteria bacterium]